MYKFGKVTLMAAAISIFSASAVFAGTWEQHEGRYKYHNDSGSYASSQMMNIDGANYGFDEQGFMAEGWRAFDGKWYYFEPGSGVQALGWKQLGNLWYYLNPANGGVMQTSWLKENTKLYYFNADGSMQAPSTRFYVGGFAYETDASGAIKRNTSEDKGDGRIFIYEDDGKMKYKNNTLVTANRAAGGDVYVYLTEQNEQVKTDTQDAIATAVEERKDELREEYKQNVENETKPNRRLKRTQDWENKVRRKLQELGVSEEEIAAFIWEVKVEPNGDYYDDSYDDYYDYD